MSGTQTNHRFAVDLIECGFFHPLDGELQPTIGELCHLPLHGLAGSVQFFHVRVEHTQDRGIFDFIVVGSEGLPERKIIEGAVVTRYASAGCVFFLRYEDGYSRIHHCLHSEAFEVAAAVAVVRYSAGWDESETIVVESPDSQYDVTVTVDDHRLWAFVKSS